METVALLFVFAIIGVIGFSIMKRLDAFLEESWKQSENATENREDIIKIACINPNMLSAVSNALEKTSEEVNGRTDD